MAVVDDVVIERLTSLGDEDALALARLVTQLSSSATPSTDFLRQVVDDPATMLFCARDRAGQIVAMLSLVTFSVPTGVRAWIEDVVVDQSRRRSGIASSLVHFACDAAREHGVRTIDLTSRPTRVEANRLYAQLGFTERETNVWRYSVPSP